MAPPGFVGYGQPGSVTETARVGSLAKAIVVMTTIVAVTTVLAALLQWSISDDAENFLDGRLAEDDFSDSLWPLSVVQMLAVFATLATGVLTIIWMYRLASNVRSLGRRTTWHPLWAVFGWVLPPFVLYIIPFLMLRELWKASGDDPAPPDGWRKSGENSALWAWFAMFGIIPTALVFGQASTIATDGLPDSDLEAVADSLDGFGAASALVTVVGLIAAVTWILVVRQITERHTALTREQ